MKQSATSLITFPKSGPLPMSVEFLGGRLTSDGGLPWVAEADHALALTQQLATAIPGRCQRRRRGSLSERLS